MILPIQTLQIVEQWDCHNCARCCRSMTITLNSDDVARLCQQKWQEHPDYHGVKTVVRESLLGGRQVLAKRDDGACVFLSSQGLCRIHELHGAESKPAICRMFPLQLVPLDRFAYITLRRSCPSAAADDGRPLANHLKSLKKSRLLEHFATHGSRPPRVVRGARRGWRDYLATADALARLTTDERLPMVRRLVHGLRFCTLLSQCKLKRVDDESFAELIHIIEDGATEETEPYFRDRQPPSAATAFVFRQIAVHYIRSHPGFPTVSTWRQRWRLTWLSGKFARGKGQVPSIHPGFPATTFQSLERPMGPLADEVSRPLNRFLETHAFSKQYAVIGHRRSLIESYRALVLTYPMALWLLRLACGERNPTTSDMIDIVAALEGGQGMTGLFRGASAMADSLQLQRLLAWYAR